MSLETTAAASRRRQQERQLDKVGRDTPAGQALLRQLATERSHHVTGSVTPAAGVSRGKPKPNGHAPAPAPATAYELLLVDQVDVGDNVRIQPGELDELVASIEEHGVLQPVKVVGPHPDGRYRLVFGQRRLLASRLAEVAFIPAIVESLTVAGDVDEPGAKRSIEQLVENLQRADLNPIDEAKALRAVLDADPKLTQAELAKRLGRSEPWLANSLRLLKLEDAVQTRVASGQLSQSHAKSLAGLAPKTQLEYADRAERSGWSAHELERQIQWAQQSEQQRQASEAEQRRRAKRQLEELIGRTDKLKVPKDARVYVDPYYGQGPVGSVVDAFHKAGFSGAQARKNQRVVSRSQAVGCDCAVWLVTVGGYSAPTFVKACEKPAHVTAKEQAASDKREHKWKTEKVVREQLAKVLPITLRPNTLLPDDVARLMLWDALGYRAADFAEKRGGKRGRPWETIKALEGVELREELGKALADAISDQYGYHLPWDELAATFGVEAPA